MQPNGPLVRLGPVTVLADRVDDDAAFRAVYENHFAPMTRLAYVTTGSLSAAEDVVQDSFLDYYHHRHRVTDPVAWLRRAVVSRCTSWVRRRVLERRHAPRGVADQPALSPDAVAVRRALTHLNPRHRAAVFLRYYLDLSEAQIAQALGCRPGTVKSLLHRGLAVLKEQLDD